MPDLAALFVGLAFAVVAACRSSAAQCPPGWSLGEGVRRDGAFACYSPVAPAGCGEPVVPERPCERPAIARGRIYCTSGMQPIVVNERTVGCTVINR